MASLLVAAASINVDAQALHGLPRIRVAIEGAGSTDRDGPIGDSGRRIVASLAHQQRQPTAGRSSGSRCAAKLVALPLAGVVLGFPVGWVTKGGVEDDKPGRHVARTMLIGGAIGLVAGAALCLV